jgi:hypothetical protein
MHTADPDLGYDSNDSLRLFISVSGCNVIKEKMVAFEIF